MSKALPPRPNLRQLRQQAKDLLKAYRAGSADAISRIRSSIPRLSDASGADVVASSCTLQDMQFVLAAEYGFTDWGALTDEVELLSGDVLAAAHAFIRHGNVERLKQIVTHDPGIVNRRPEPNGGTLLHTASFSPSTEIVRFLIAQGADVNARSGEGWMPLHTAAEGNHHANVDALLEGGADVFAEACGDGGTPLAHALFGGAREAAALLVKKAVTPRNLRVAAGIGDVRMLGTFFTDDGTLIPEAGSGRGFYRHHAEYPEWTPSNDAQEILDEAFVYACKNRQRDAIEFLLDHGANIDGMPYEHTGLHAAVQHDDLALVQYLVSRGADLQVKDRAHGGTPYNWAEHLGRPEIREFLEGTLAEPDSSTGGGESLAMAVRRSQVERVKSLSAAASLETMNAAFHVAALREKTEIARILLAAGAKPSLFDLISTGLEEAVVERLEDGEDPNTTRELEVEVSGKFPEKRKQTVLKAAAEAGQRAIGERLVEAGAAVDLHDAAFLDRLADVRRGLNGSGDVDARDAFGRTLLHRAIQGSAVATAKWLLENGASVETHADTYTFGAKAIHVAAGSGSSTEMIDLLIAAGADVNSKMNPGTPVEAARRRGKVRAVEVLRARGARD